MSYFGIGEKENNHLNQFGLNTNNKNQRKQSINDGFCIRCGDLIPFNPDMPYYSSCFSSWSNNEDMKYLEHYCHKCGNLDDDISMARPLCFSWWKDWKIQMLYLFKKK